jgi:HKD family nuclease
MKAASFVVQTHDETALLFTTIRSLLLKPGLQRVRIATAYARWDGLGLISSELEKMLAQGGRLETIYGAGNGVTTPDSLLYGLYLKELYPSRVVPLLVEDKFANSIFHPKLFAFKFPTFSVAVVGSANLTGGGLVRNSEVAVQIRGAAGETLEQGLDTTWDKLVELARPVTPKRVREIMRGENAGSEADQRESLPKVTGKPNLKTGPKTAPKPLFKRVLKLKDATKKSKILSKLDSLSQKPTRLYLQIFATETGGSAGKPGYQVQLPVATLGAYFGVGETQTKKVEFRFRSETVETNLTHFDNHTHRVRLKPILQIPRPSVLVFERVADDVYEVRPVPPARYATSLASKCTQQSRSGSRRWGLE